MRCYPIIIVLLAFGAVSGCWSGEQRTTDCERYASGELKSIGEVTSVTGQKLFFGTKNLKYTATSVNITSTADSSRSNGPDMAVRSLAWSCMRTAA